MVGGSGVMLIRYDDVGDAGYMILGTAGLNNHLALLVRIVGMDEMKYFGIL